MFMSHDRQTALEAICLNDEDSTLAKTSRRLAAQELELWANQLVEFGAKTPGTRVDNICQDEAERLRGMARLAKATNRRQHDPGPNKEFWPAPE